MPQFVTGQVVRPPSYSNLANAIKGQNAIANYVNARSAVAWKEGNLDAHIKYQKLAEIVSDPFLGLVLGELLVDLQSLLIDDIENQPTGTVPVID